MAARYYLNQVQLKILLLVDSLPACYSGTLQTFYLAMAYPGNLEILEHDSGKLPGTTANRSHCKLASVWKPMGHFLYMGC